ncbi:Gfo/Idh/MocA family protein [Roseateles oligotrophus]|uniref:Gfo/Idh/MocA family oxidoreductase n=1 Tax=Roseateles oligotrophus TaxID=1769250 RepID=A0ABT2YHU4_9BURK|nr:Gfo/Idh/MocA family oxidoreductase [Roseateles oligotrophus]MCV2369629.1 Gfo/Idh/MocA family oxidoreductase [Roseateles oligotrophus]
MMAASQIKPTAVAIIGAGDIFPAYAKGLAQFGNLRLIGVADAKPEAAQSRAAEFDLPLMSLDQLLGSEAEIIINLTPPLAHRAVGEAVLKAGKHLYTEKPLAGSFADGAALMEKAAALGLRIGCAPDTFLGGAGQAARALVDANGIGRIVAGQATMMERGPDDWHPNPEFFYRPGAGPLMDMGVYYLTQLVQLLGPITLVSGLAHTSWPLRQIPRGPRQGEHIKVETPTHLVAGLTFEQGAFITLSTSFDVWKHKSSHIELFGELGSLVLPDPNQFGGELELCVADGDWAAQAPLAFTGRHRGLGVAEMADALRSGRPHRASGEMALHVLEAMDAILRSAEQQAPLALQTRCARPDPVPAGFAASLQMQEQCA